MIAVIETPMRTAGLCPSVVLTFASLAGAAFAADAPRIPPMMLAQAGSEAKAPHTSVVAPAEPEDTPEARMAKRFPQPVRVGDLVGLPVLDDDDTTLGRVREVVRDPQGKIKLIVSYSKFFGWNGHPVAVPIEVVAILARQIAAVDMPRAEFAAAPTWSATDEQPIPADETIRIAITRR
jgi:hypothetical protein